MTNQLTSIDFHGQTLLATIQDNVVYTALKPICENIGLSWNAQFERIKRDEVLAEGIRMIRTPTKGGVSRSGLFATNAFKRLAVWRRYKPCQS